MALLQEMLTGNIHEENNYREHMRMHPSNGVCISEHRD
jgi:hypothetical protein